MEFNKLELNPMLVGAIELAKAEPTPEHNKLVSDEIIKAHLLCPAAVTPAPEPNAAGELRPAPGSQVQFPILSASDGKQFFMAYTDMEELKKWKDVEGQQFFSMTFDDYATMLLQKDDQGRTSPAAGFVINPFGGNIVVSREMAAQYVMARAKQREAAKAQENETKQR